MNVKITPGKASGVVVVPPSKSMAHRMLICAGLAEGVSIVENIELSEDIKATLGMLEQLGATYTIEGRSVRMSGMGTRKVKLQSALDSNESGSTLRFFIPIVLAKGIDATFVGAKRLLERPLSVYEEICKEQGILFEKEEGRLCVSGTLFAKHYKVQGDISSQFITGLLFALPLLEENSVLEVLPPIESKPYIDMTLEALQTFGVKIKQEGTLFWISGKQSYQSKNVCVEGDYSNAAFLDALTLIGGSVETIGLREDSLQGDKIYQTYYQELQKEEPRIDLAECPDLGPILMGLAGALHGAYFTGTKRLKIKESDRGAAMAEELKKFGIRVDVGENDITVFPGTLQTPTEDLSSHNDHRIAMTMATLCTITGGNIEGADSVKKSFPSYFDVIESLGIQVSRLAGTEE